MILITGSRGVLGTALQRELHGGTEEIVSLSSADVDLRDSQAATEVVGRLKPRLVYHLAAKVHGIMGNRNFPADMFTDNVRINTNVIDAASRAGCEKFVAVSTVAVYSSTAPMPTGEDEVWNGPPHNSEAPYGHAKRAMLAQLQAYAAQYGLRYAYAVMTNIYGPHDRFDIAHGHVIPSLVAKFFSAASNKTGVEVWGSGKAERDFIHAADAARALRLIGEAAEGLLNVATGETATIRQVVAELSRISGVKEVSWDDSKPDGQLLRKYDVSRLAALGFKARVSLAEGLEDTFTWYRQNFPNVRT